MPESFTRKNQNLPEAKQFIIQHLSHNCLQMLPFFLCRPLYFCITIWTPSLKGQHSKDEQL